MQPTSSTSNSSDVLALLYREHHRWLRTWLQSKLQCPQDAADLTQDTFLGALASEQLTQLKEPRAFLSTLAHRLLYKFWRRQQLERSYLATLAQQPEAFIPSEEDLALVREALEYVDRLLDGLPIRVRKVFLLNRLEGMTQPAIAAHLNISLATVERDLRRAYIHCLAPQVDVL